MITYKDELYHHGIKGQKWGVRRFQNEDGSLTPAGQSRYSDSKAAKYGAKADKHIAKISTSKTRLGRNFHNYMAYNHESTANLRQARADATTIRDKLSATIGRANIAADQRASANYYARKAAMSTTKFGRTRNEARAFNFNSAAKSNEILSKSKFGKEYATNYAKAVFARPVKTWSGRQITTGKAFMESFSIDGGLVKDIKYYKSHN